MLFIAMPDPYDLTLSLALLRHGPLDPTTRLEDDGVWRTMRTPAGPATLHLRRAQGGVEAVAYGDGAEFALTRAPAICGVEDDPDAYAPAHPVLVDLARRYRGVRFPKTRTIMDSLLPAITEQKVTSVEAFESYRGMVFAFGERAPGPVKLWLPPDPARVATSPYFTMHRYGLERKRMEIVQRVCARATRMEEAATMSPGDARNRLRAMKGIGAWTAAEVTRVSHGDPDAVSVGDFHLPHLVSWALAGEARGTDERMLKLLSGEKGHRGRALRYLELSGIRAPKFGPRQRVRRIAEI